LEVIKGFKKKGQENLRRFMKVLKSHNVQRLIKDTASESYEGLLFYIYLINQMCFINSYQLLKVKGLQTEVSTGNMIGDALKYVKHISTRGKYGRTFQCTMYGG
jgi:hypothetical protein